ncbi:uncharacterized protein MKK02DRAFT_40635 [Dioszegia hungarica]|uniref:Maintenance of mitochondrial morphology protein 1 n=1 Tax=Dioszegia hungarica TaxID=4972 RepID=A0AA38H298_9TREE|nr:uncharacterized protein MKK02DRAFT_40635 [Dioszegia hungarica]KAI9632331.1 hypothetical protein MKK02DRAFT_40635 [Dioszegia hungarica]
MSVRTVEPASSQWTFTQGLILGQASFLLLTLVFIRYVVFSPADRRDGEDWRKRRDERVRKSLAASNKLPPPPPSQILAKTSYDMSTHAAESTGWINVLFAQVMQGYRNDLLSAGGEEGARVKVEKWLNPESGAMSWLDPIKVTSISLGTSYPLFSNARIRPADGQGHLRAEIDMDYSDAVSLSLSTAVLVNFPRPRFAVLPVSLGVELAAIGGTLSVQIHDPVEGRQHLHACLLPDFHLNLKTTSLLGSRAKLQDIPKLEQLLLSRIRSLIQDRIVHPKTFSFSLPQILNNRTNLSSKEFMADLGEEAKEVMSQAVRQGLGQIVNDLGLGGDSAETSQVGTDTRGTSLAGGTNGPEMRVHSATPSGAAGGGGGRKIHMPAGFPGGSSSSRATPLPTPGVGGSSRIPQPSFSGAYQTPGAGPGSGLGSTSAYRNPAMYAAQRNLPSAGGAASGSGDDAFRFRGQFASQPGTPGAGGAEDRRRVGALNSRAG